MLRERGFLPMDVMMAVLRESLGRLDTNINEETIIVLEGFPFNSESARQFDQHFGMPSLVMGLELLPGRLESVKQMVGISNKGDPTISQFSMNLVSGKGS
eukprot:Protomagalhaensia_sp_Gyna_25__5488@NODE_729_length_2748_cov_20_325951_g568_i0_p4_GENE_NODE_729_length_2748_cov_20_325951_g568_i0NODE_729_length_2748_cov_20_325951_g568_i0_p4_ORF_typecomplete_len100_score15_66ADK/PF00406_22/0_0042_NODE_729_length_2748_cov_20_325951_g568_i0691990